MSVLFERRCLLCVICALCVAGFIFRNQLLLQKVCRDADTHARLRLQGVTIVVRVMDVLLERETRQCCLRGAVYRGLDCPARDRWIMHAYKYKYACMHTSMHACIQVCMHRVPCMFTLSDNKKHYASLCDFVFCLTRTKKILNGYSTRVKWRAYGRIGMCIHVCVIHIKL
jgi:hypothetical protein